MIIVTDLSGKKRYLTEEEFSEYKRIFEEYNPMTGYTPKSNNSKLSEDLKKYEN
jgi:hypothetical protein